MDINAVNMFSDRLCLQNPIPEIADAARYFSDRLQMNRPLSELTTVVKDNQQKFGVLG